MTTVNSTTVFLVRLGDATTLRTAAARSSASIRTVWDVATNTLHVESDELLDQHTRYALIVTRGVQDAAGQPVEPSEAFGASATTSISAAEDRPRLARLP